MQIYDVYIPYTKFNNLTKEEAIAYSQGHNIYKDNFQGHEVKRISFYVKKDYMAMIEYFIPSLDNKIVQKLQKKKKKMSWSNYIHCSIKLYEYCICLFYLKKKESTALVV